MESATLTPEIVPPGTGRLDALTTIAPFVESRVDDVLVRHLALPGLTTVRLAFGVGLRDEPAMLAGITHLAEHLIMAGLPTPDFDHNAEVDADLICFTATGTTDEVTHFIRDIGACLQSLDLSALPRERRVVTTEGQRIGPTPHDAGLAFNLGVTGPALGLVEPQPDRISDADVRAHIGHYLCKENATLAVVGPMPEVLTIPLPSRGEGAEFTRYATPWQPMLGPVWVENDCPLVVLTMQLPAEATVARAMAELLQARLTTSLRFTHGLSYEVALELSTTDEGHLAVISLDCLAGEEVQVARMVFNEVVNLATDGPALDELLRIRRLARRDLSSPYLLLDHFDEWQLAMGRGLTYFEPLEHAEFRDAASVEGLRDWFADRLETVAILVPPGARPFTRKDPIRAVHWCPAVEGLPEGQEFRATWRNRFFFGDRRERLVVTDDVLAYRERGGRVHQIWWDDVVDVQPMSDDPRDFTVLGVGRCLIPVQRSLFGRRAAHRVRDHLERRGII